MESMQIESKSQREFIMEFNKMITRIYKEVQTVKNMAKTVMKNKRVLSLIPHLPELHLEALSALGPSLCLISCSSPSK